MDSGICWHERKQGETKSKKDSFIESKATSEKVHHHKALKILTREKKTIRLQLELTE